MSSPPASAVAAAPPASPSAATSSPPPASGSDGHPVHSKIAPDYGLISVPTRMRSRYYRQDNSSCGGKGTRFPGPELPEDIWCHIHSLMPMRDAACAACVSRAFLRSWRCHPNLVFNLKTLGCRFTNIWDFERKVDDIVKKHSGIGVKTFSLEWDYGINAKACSYLDSWIQMAVTPGIEELTLNTYSMYSRDAEYNFPCSLLSDDGRGSSIRYLRLAGCAFRPTVELGCCLRSLTTLNLCRVRITRDQLGCLLSGVRLWSGWNSSDALR